MKDSGKDKKIMKETVAEVHDLTKEYGKTRALIDVNLSLRRGEILGLVGDNGSGKSTFLKLLAGQIFPTKGEVILFGAHGVVSGLAWMGVVFLLPAVFYMAGFEIPLLAKIASWMPRNYLMTDVIAGMSGYLCLWSEPAGAVKCILAGVAGIIVFAAAGVFMNRRKEI